MKVTTVWMERFGMAAFVKRAASLGFVLDGPSCGTPETLYSRDFVYTGTRPVAGSLLRFQKMMEESSSFVMCAVATDL